MDPCLSARLSVCRARARMSEFLNYDKTTAINSFKAQEGVHGTARRVVLSWVDNLIVLCTNASAQNLKTALAKYNDKCEDMEIAEEKLVCIESANPDEYLKVLEDISWEREELHKRNWSLQIQTGRTKTTHNRKCEQQEWQK